MSALHGGVSEQHAWPLVPHRVRQIPAGEHSRSLQHGLDEQPAPRVAQVGGGALQVWVMHD